MITENYLDRDYVKGQEDMMRANSRIMEELTYNHKITYNYKLNKWDKERDGFRRDTLREDYIALRSQQISRETYILNKLTIKYSELGFNENPIKYDRLRKLALRINEFHKNASLYKFIIKMDLLFKSLDEVIDIKDYLK